MNKSKFLKKSLAALLAILMVAAMIPLSAAAAGDTVVVDINDDEGNLLNRDTITVTQGKLSGEDGAYTVTLPYDQSSTNISVTTDRKDVDVYSVNAEGKETLTTGVAVPVTGVPSGGSKTATVVLRSQNAEVGADPVATYEFTVSVPSRSGSTVVTGATYKYNMDSTAKTVTGKVEGNTITFAKLPWGHVDSLTQLDGTHNQVALTLAEPTTGYENTFPAPAASPTPVTGITDGEKSVQVTAQNGNTAQYNLVFTEEDCLTGLTIDGEEAVKDATDPTGMTYKVVVDAENANAPVKVTTTKGATGSTRFQYHFGSYTSTYNNQTTLDTTTHTYSLRIADKEATPNFKTYTVNIEVRQNADPSVDKFIVWDGTYNETGVVATNGDMSAVLVNETTFPVNGVLSIATKGKVKAAVLNGSVDCQESASIATTPAKAITFGTSVNKVSLSATNTIAITAEDGTQKTYKLSLSADPNKTKKPAVTKAVMNLVDKSTGNTTSYTAEIKDKVITFNVPASADKDDINAALAERVSGVSTDSADPAITFEWETTSHTEVDGMPRPLTSNYKDYLNSATSTTPNADFFDNAALFKEKDPAPGAGEDPNEAVDDKVENTITVKADGIAAAGEDWTIVFHQNTPEPGKRLTGFKFYNAAKQDKVTDGNTYTAKIVESEKSVTVEKKLPYGTVNSSANTNNGDNIAIEFEVSTGASLWYATDETTNLQAITASGWNDDKTPKFTIPAKILTNAKILVVADEAFTAGLTPFSGSDKMGTSSADTWTEIVALSGGKAGHAVKYTLDVKGEDASEATDILSLEEVDGQVVSFIDVENGTVEVVVPETYVTEGSEKEFDLTITTAPLVSAVSLRDADGVDISGATPNTDTGVIEMLKVVANDDGTYSLMSGTSAIKSIAVTAENSNFKKIYTVTVSAKTLSDDTTLNSISVNGVEAKQAGGYGMWSIVLPSGTDLTEITEDSFVVDIVETATYSIAPGEEEDTYVITVTAEDGKTTVDHTVALVVNDEPENPFTDIGDPNDPNNWSASSIITASQNGWILGMGNGKFDPKGQMTRAQFALIIARIQAGGNDAWEEIAGDYTTDVYDDVSATNDYMNAIAYVTEEGIMSGKGAGKFDPNGTITRQEAAKVMAVASGLEEIPGNTTYSDDASIAGWAKGYVNAVTEYNIMNGMGAGFSPNVKLTREMGATILVRAFDKADEPNEPDEPTE